ncbi:hypothetical protein [Paenibacillus tarimensis]|uniref:hypothetical protein n=1 Tax=Paenibacillus tarimensis TaxID=416012 RepID=UPI001F28A011|nr:hypothetical protein [Paenibacillus tarimensis]MCF2946476.1 hypothetical protein [Paenibacillus tarimensis]
MFKKFSVLILVLSIMILPGQVLAKDVDASQKGKPTKIEYITTKNSEIVPLLYFESSEDANLYRQQKMENSKSLQYSPIDQNTNQIGAMASEGFNYLGYAGVFAYDYQYVYYRNTTTTEKKWTRTIQRGSSSKTSISVNAEFPKVFKAQVGVEFANSTTFTDTFEVLVPPNKQGEIWSWNDAKWYNWSYTSCGWFSCSTSNFSATRPTDNFGYEIYILDFRDPSGGA